MYSTPKPKLYAKTQVVQVVLYIETEVVQYVETYVYTKTVPVQQGSALNHKLYSTPNHKLYADSES